eukprot:COSAG02_NODE_34833_length_477_cov_1.648148_1_plen_48_part_10
MRSNHVSLVLKVLWRVRLRKLPSTEEELLHRDLKKRVEQGKLRAKDKI